MDLYPRRGDDAIRWRSEPVIHVCRETSSGHREEGGRSLTFPVASGPAARMHSRYVTTYHAPNTLTFSTVWDAGHLVSQHAYVLTAALTRMTETFGT